MYSENADSDDDCCKRPLRSTKAEMTAATMKAAPKATMTTATTGTPVFLHGQPGSGPAGCCGADDSPMVVTSMRVNGGGLCRFTRETAVSLAVFQFAAGRWTHASEETAEAPLAFAADGSGAMAKRSVQPDRRVSCVCVSVGDFV